MGGITSKKLRSVSMIVAIVACSEATVAKAQDTPQLCKDGQTTSWTFALGKTVYEISNIISVSHALAWVQVTDVPAANKLKAPNPAVPTGCLMNPEQILSLRAGGWQFFGSSRTTDQSFFKNFPILGQFQFSYSLTTKIAETGRRLLFNSDYLKCDPSLQVKKRWNDGTYYCGNKKILLNFTKTTKLGWKLVLSQRHYPPLFVSPISNIVFNNTIEGAHTIYAISPLLSVSYYAYISPSPIESLPDRTISFDQEFRKRLNGIEVKNYRWNG